MKASSIFGLVFLFHAAVAVLLYMQPGCQSRPPVGTSPAPAYDPNYQRPSTPSFSPAPASSSARPSGLATPTRPEEPLTPPLPAPTEGDPFNAGLLEPVGSDEAEAAPTPTGSSRAYTIQAGDTLSKIARREGISLDALLAANGLNRNSTIFVGDEIILPAGGASAAPAAATGSATPTSGTSSYSVRAGDNLTVIARRHGLTVRELKAMNNLQSDNIQVGQVLMVPTGSSPSPTPAPNRPATAPAATPASGNTYTIQSGDTAGAIARRFGVNVQDLLSANNVQDPRRLQVGQVLVIPGGGQVTANPPATPTPAPAAPAPAPAPAPAAPRIQEQPSQPQILTPPPPPPPEIESLEADEDLPFVDVAPSGENP